MYGIYCLDSAALLIHTYINCHSFQQWRKPLRTGDYSQIPRTHLYGKTSFLWKDGGFSLLASFPLAVIHMIYLLLYFHPILIISCIRTFHLLMLQHNLISFTDLEFAFWNAHGKPKSEQCEFHIGWNASEASPLSERSVWIKCHTLAILIYYCYTSYVHLYPSTCVPMHVLTSVYTD